MDQSSPAIQARKLKRSPLQKRQLSGIFFNIPKLTDTVYGNERFIQQFQEKQVIAGGFQ
jgi:hypothetical protein